MVLILFGCLSVHLNPIGLFHFVIFIFLTDPIIIVKGDVSLLFAVKEPLSHTERFGQRGSVASSAL